MTSQLFMEERRRIILDQLRQLGRVSVNNLSELLNVSAVTIRQDLKSLEADGLLERTHGGAVERDPNRVVQSELSFDIRRAKNFAEKEALGRAAAAMVKDGYGIAIDASSTACSLVQYLGDIDGLTVVTNSIIVTEQLLGNIRAEVILPGGRLRRDSVSLIGSPQTLPDVNLNIGFVSAWGITREAAMTEVSSEETEMKRALLNLCLTKVVLVDSSKWGQVAPYTYAKFNEIDKIITTDNVPEEVLREYESLALNLEVITL
ncbi:MAG: DeoR/GlpR family DNA-binding transcription regulator [Aggregatilineales bacterium]